MNLSAESRDGRAADGVIDLAERLSQLDEHWAPKIVARLNDYEIKVVKLAGEFVWHSHDDTDELFLVLAGQLTIQLRDRPVRLGPGQLFVVPRGAVWSTGRWPTARCTRCSSNRAAWSTPVLNRPGVSGGSIS